MSLPVSFPGTPRWGSETPGAPQSIVSPEAESGIMIKSMRLKVLYTFDEHNQTNCLARWPQVLQIRTVAMDDGKAIGVVDLKTCVQAVVQCSPELVAHLGQDYTIYAHDYSEFDVPLVGQGMLSWALAAASPTADSTQSQQLVTGRVCKNIQGLFTNGVAETLEVKLRLAPIPRVQQRDYIQSMEKYREISRATPPGFDPKEWLNYLQSNPGMAQAGNKPAPSQVGGHTPREGVSMELVNQLLSPSLPPTSLDPFAGGQEMRIDQSLPANLPQTAESASRPSSRNSVKRPYKRRTKSKAVAGGNTSGYEGEGTDGDADDVPVGPKRAKIVQTDWNSKSSFGAANDSLRVTASTAGSLRAFRPLAMAPAPSGDGKGHLQDVPRAPTPVPDASAFPSVRGKAQYQSGLRRSSFTTHMVSQPPRRYQSPYQQPEPVQDPQEQIRASIESAMTSPEKNNDSAGESPQDFGSSPPVRRTASPMQISPAPSSPMLPPMPRTDSGFMSGGVSELFEEDEDTRHGGDLAQPDAIKHKRQQHSRPMSPAPQMHHNFLIEEVPGPPELLPTKILPRTVRPRAEPKPKAPRPRGAPRRAGSTLSDAGITYSESLPPIAHTASMMQNSGFSAKSPLAQPDAPHSVPLELGNGSQFQVSEARIPAPELAASNLPESLPSPALPMETSETAPVIYHPAPRTLQRTASLGALTLPAVAASDPIQPPSNLHRSESLQEPSHPVTDAPSALDRQNSTVSASAVAKKNSIRLRLETAIRKGEMPPFCSNCGAIETPAWRKAYTRVFNGPPGFCEYSDEPGRITAIDIMERDDSGNPSQYKIFKKSLGSGEDKAEFSEILLCNPCGIWMSKYKSQRPENKWVKDQERALALQTGEKPERKRRERSSKAKGSQNDSRGRVTSEAPFPSDGPVPAGATASIAPTNISTNMAAPVSGAAANATSHASLITCAQPPPATSRDVPSSPPRGVGSRLSPIDIEEDLGTTRRILFPSPRKDEVAGVLSEVMINVGQPSISSHRARASSKELVLETIDKENCPPTPLFQDDAELRKLFEETPRPPRPTTPVRDRVEVNPFKTPTRPTPSHRPITRSISKSAQRSADMRDMMPQRTPSKTPSASARRRSPRFNRNVVESPFTATLNKLLSEANEHYDVGAESPSRNLDLELDFSALPGLGHSAAVGFHSDAMAFGMHGFDPNTDYFSTDIPMPSSPPRFNLYEDSTAMHTDNVDHALWSEFAMETTSLHLGASFAIDENGRATFDVGKTGSGQAEKVIKKEHSQSPEKREDRRAPLGEHS